MSKPSNIVMHNFTQLVQAKQMALALMDEGVQFAFCPSPMSISHPMNLMQAREDQPSAG